MFVCFLPFILHGFSRHSEPLKERRPRDEFGALRSYVDYKQIDIKMVSARKSQYHNRTQDGIRIKSSINVTSDLVTYADIQDMDNKTLVIFFCQRA